jgi:hypothetical protein
MTSRGYLAALALGAASWCGLLAAFVGLVDPYGLISDGAVQRGWRSIKIEDPWRDGRAMRLALLLRQPKTILLGSSRVVLGYDAGQLRETQYWPAYNASSYNSGLAHRLSMLKYAAAIDRRLKHVLIEIFPGDIIHAPDFWVLQPIKPTILGIAAEAIPLMLSATALRDSAQVIVRSRAYRDQPLSGRQNLIRDGQDRLGMKTLPYSAFTAYRMFPPKATVDPNWSSIVDEIDTTCRLHELHCAFFVSPLNARILYGYHHYNLWPELEALTSRLASMGGAYDFLRFNSLSVEPPDAKMSEWIDPLHHTAAVGNMILHAISGKKPLRTGGNEAVGDKLTQENASIVIAQLRAQRDRWISEHPEIAWSYDQLSNSLANPVGKSTVAEESGIVRIQIGDKAWIARGEVKSEPSLFGCGFSPVDRSGVVSGWAADSENKRIANNVAVVYGNNVVTFGRPWFDASQNGRLKVPLGVERSGFQFGFKLPPEAVPGKRLRVFALFESGSAVELGPDQGNLNW